MQVSETIHAIEVPFQIPISPEKQINRTVYAFLVFGDSIAIIDSGVSGTDSLIFDYIRQNGRAPGEVKTLVLSHSHPDHIGSAGKIKSASGCRVLAHPAERNWIEDVEKQARERPVPGFKHLVDGPVALDGTLEDGDRLDFGSGIQCTVYHTPGHSIGSLSLFFKNEKILFTGDALPLPNDLPIYDDISTCMQSIRKLGSLAGQAETLLSSWEAPVRGNGKIRKRIQDSAAYLKRIHNAVLQTSTQNRENIMELSREVITTLGLPPFAVNPLTGKAFASSLAAAADENLFAVQPEKLPGNENP